jgi:hypothetical protein
MVLGDAGDLSGSPGSSCFARSLDKSELSWHHPSSRCGSGLRRLVRGNQTGREGDEKDLIELHMFTMGSAASAFGIAPNNCMVVNGSTVCKSPIDKLNPMENGKTNYRDALPLCSTHATVDNSTGATQSHTDLFNPQSSIPSIGPGGAQHSSATFSPSI